MQKDFNGLALLSNKVINVQNICWFARETVRFEFRSISVYLVGKGNWESIALREQKKSIWYYIGDKGVFVLHLWGYPTEKLRYLNTKKFCVGMNNVW